MRIMILYVIVQDKTEYILNDLIYLLRIEEEYQSHYIYVKHIERLLNTHKLTCHKDKQYCPICSQQIVITKDSKDPPKGAPPLGGEIEVDKFRQHLATCHKFAKESTLIKLPEEGSKLSFKNHKNKLERPVIAYFDLECTLRNTYDEEKIAKTMRLIQHVFI